MTVNSVYNGRQSRTATNSQYAESEQSCSARVHLLRQVSWEARLADFDNDGVLEAMQACGFIKGKINRWPELQSLGTSNDRIVHDPRLWPSFKPGADLSGHDLNPFFVRARGWTAAADLIPGDLLATDGEGWIALQSRRATGESSSR